MVDEKLTKRANAQKVARKTENAMGWLR